MPRPRKNITLNFADITTVLQTGVTLKLKVLAEEYGTCPPVIKRYLAEYYGEKIDFVPGRNGGIRFMSSVIQKSPTMAVVA
jgi:hypothetical protein